MQQAIYNNSTSNGITSTSITSTSTSIQAAKANKGTTAARPAGLLRWVARKWELVGVLALMGSSAAYGVFALAHVGL